MRTDRDLQHIEFDLVTEWFALAKNDKAMLLTVGLILARDPPRLTNEQVIPALFIQGFTKFGNAHAQPNSVRPWSH